MKKLASFVCLLSLFAAVPARAAIDALDNVPAATLLLPYFAIDLLNPNERTLARIGNISGNEVLAHAVLWTDRGVPTFSFDLRLAAHDVAEIDLRAIFVNGVLPQTSPGGFAGCTASLPPPTLSAATLTALRNAHRGQASALLGGNCGGAVHGDNLARGYLTLDVVNQCTSSSTFPATAGYFIDGGTGIARNDNVLFGEYATFDSFLGTAQGDALVAIEASDTDPASDGVDSMVCPSFCPPASLVPVSDYTFYRRVIGSHADNREGLPERWFARYQNDAPASQTTALVWRDPGAVAPFPCGNPPPGLGLQMILAFDEQENPSVDCPVINALPYAAQALDLSDPSKVGVPFKGGFMLYELQRAQALGELDKRNQGFVTHVVRRQWAATVPLLPPSIETGQLAAWPLRPITDEDSRFFDIDASCPQCQNGLDDDGDGQIDFPNDLQCRAPSGIEQTECSDGIDNDGDNLIDWPADPDCWGPSDRLEAGPGNPQCDDGLDNDGDGLIDWPSDPRCALDPFQPIEAEGVCGDGIDNDGDGKTDYPNDPGCTSRSDNDETDPQCRDGLDNDGDGKTDYPNDPGCQDANSNNESPQCNDTQDNDNDGQIDLADSACTAAYLNLEGTACSDGLDNDNDGLFDFPADPGCASPTSNTENPQCNNGVDNDGDGLIDMADPGCSSPSDNSENTPQCSDGQDNDGNGLIDWPNDPGCSSPSDNFEGPDCRDMVIVNYNFDTNPPTPIYGAIDNDFDGLANYPDDPGCASPNDYNELGGTTTRQCSDNIDNDGDGRTDYPSDSGCASRGDDLEFRAGDTLAPSAPPTPFVAPAPIPSLSQLGLLMATALLALMGMFGFRRSAMKD